MSGHSKWHSIRHKKAAVDAKRGKIFTKLIKEISVAARLGGGDPDANPRLRAAVQAAKAANMPQDNIKRAIQKGTGELPGQSYEEVTYEGYGPGGVAVFVEALTDNRNRTVAEIRRLFSKHGGSLGEAGSVQWMFERKGYIGVAKDAVEEERLLEIVLEAGAEDLESDGDLFAVYTPFESFDAVRDAVEKAGIPIEESSLIMIPHTEIKVEGKTASQVLGLMEALEDHDDVQHVYSNFDIDREALESFVSS
ncbi:MAG TPA: YebC/PmpR family DNA-binding transcriptional regulator [Acidobacteriota bacterium]|jgi:YebC/PmpR family DNA-binding regulatory protein|nr:YebC/PmpR family DNA-binding transcriptional regulator [Acidobacteriota bacterium]HRR56770.1 YebC/PmpR family DNA-binding transcriptional regulator [Acidobacteriota bacterium]HRV07654.1 YebC/PmpR family DNA-binding transcriptional regulator [Acidobacteriota bacterium]